MLLTAPPNLIQLILRPNHHQNIFLVVRSITFGGKMVALLFCYKISGGIIIVNQFSPNHGLRQSDPSFYSLCKSSLYLPDGQLERLKASPRFGLPITSYRR